MSTAFEIPEWLLTASPPAPPADDHRIEEMVNHFIAGKQEALFTAPDAFYRLQGADAVDGQPAINERLQALRAATLDLARDYGERAALGPRLDLHLDDAADGIDRHVAEQRRVYQRQVVSQRQALIQRAAELEHDNDDKILGLAEANATAAREGARMDGIAPDSPEEAAAVLGARSDILRRAIDERIANRKGAQALALFDRIKDQLSAADRQSLDTPVQATRLDQAADQWIARESGTDGAPLKDRVDDDPDLPADSKPIVRAKLDARESADESARVAKVQALDDELHEASGVQIFNPNAYRPGTFARIADAYEAAGEPGRAAFARRMAAQDAFIVPFAQASAEKQQRMIDELPVGELRDSAVATRDGQAQSFEHDAFAAGTTIYKEVGAPVPIDDIEGRIRQARQISQLRGGITVVPFTLREIDSMQRILATGSEQDKQAVRNRLAAVPADMQLSIAPRDEPVPAGSRHSFGVIGGPSVLPEPTESGDGASAIARAGQSGSPATEPAPRSPEDQAVDADARRPVAELEKPRASPVVGTQGGFTGPEPAPGSDLYRIAERQARSEQTRERVETDRMISQWASKAQSGSQMPTELVERLGPDERQKVRDLASSDAATTSDPAVLAEIVNGLRSRNPAEQRQWAQVPLYRYKSQLSANDFQKVVDLQNDLEPEFGYSRSELASIRTQLANRPDTSDLDGFYKALEPNPDVDYSERWPFGVDSGGKIRWFVLPNSARRFLKGTLDLLKGTKTGELTPEAVEAFTALSSGAGQALGPVGDEATFAAGGKRLLSKAESQRRRDQLKKNQRLGKEHEDKMARIFAQDPDLVFQRRITVAPLGGGPRTVLDFLTYHLKTKQFGYHEGKGSETAPLSRNQTLSYPKIEAKGLVIKGKGKWPFVGGLELPGKKVNIVRPKDVD